MTRETAETHLLVILMRRLALEGVGVNARGKTQTLLKKTFKRAKGHLLVGDEGFEPPTSSV